VTLKRSYNHLVTRLNLVYVEATLLHPRFKIVLTPDQFEAAKLQLLHDVSLSLVPPIVIFVHAVCVTVTLSVTLSVTVCDRLCDTVCVTATLCV